LTRDVDNTATYAIVVYVAVVVCNSGGWV